MNDGGTRVAICAIAKNEGPYLEEWVAYHHLVGFGPIRVYDHESTDDTPAVLERLGAAGLAESTPWSAPPDKKPQWLAYEDGLEQLRDRADWIAFIDLDEFIVLPQHDSVQAFLHDHGEGGAIAINWKIFGSSGHEKRESGLVIERFTRCAKRSFSGNRAVKTLARVDTIVRPRVHTCEFRPGVRYATVDGQELGPRDGRVASPTHDVVHINHYFTRSREEWDQKAARGRGAKTADDPKKHRTIAEFESHDRNELEDLEMQAFIGPVRGVILGLPSREAPPPEAADAPTVGLSSPRERRTRGPVVSVRSHAQHGEDLQIAYFLGKERGKRYIDVGCLYPRRLSNSYYFYERDGSGLCIDPNPMLAEQFAEERPRDLFLNAAISDEPGRLAYNMYGNPVFNTLSAERAKYVLRKAGTRPGRELVETIDVDVMTLDAAVEQTGLADRLDGTLDLLTIDVEGFELEVVRGFSFAALRPRLVVLEHIRRKRNDAPPAETPLHAAMVERGYWMAGYTGHDMYFLDEGA